MYAPKTAMGVPTHIAHPNLFPSGLSAIGSPGSGVASWTKVADWHGSLAAFQFIEDRLEHFPYRLVNVKPAAGVFDIGGSRESEFRIGQQDDHYGCEDHATAEN